MDQLIFAISKNDMDEFMALVYDEGIRIRHVHLIYAIICNRSDMVFQILLNSDLCIEHEDIERYLSDDKHYETIMLMIEKGYLTPDKHYLNTLVQNNAFRVAAAILETSIVEIAEDTLVSAIIDDNERAISFIMNQGSRYLDLADAMQMAEVIKLQRQ